MSKEKRKLYRISGMRQKGWNYIRRGLAIQRMNYPMFVAEMPKVIPEIEIGEVLIIPPVKIIPKSWIYRFYLWLKSFIRPKEK